MLCTRGMTRVWKGTKWKTNLGRRLASFSSLLFSFLGSFLQFGGLWDRLGIANSVLLSSSLLFSPLLFSSLPSLPFSSLNFSAALLRILSCSPAPHSELGRVALWDNSNNFAARCEMELWKRWDVDEKSIWDSWQLQEVLHKFYTHCSDCAMDVDKIMNALQHCVMAQAVAVSNTEPCARSLQDPIPSPAGHQENNKHNIVYWVLDNH